MDRLSTRLYSHISCNELINDAFFATVPCVLSASSLLDVSQLQVAVGGHRVIEKLDIDNLSKHSII